jgi:hypothetical protein
MWWNTLSNLKNQGYAETAHAMHVSEMTDDFYRGCGRFPIARQHVLRVLVITVLTLTTVLSSARGKPSSYYDDQILNETGEEIVMRCKHVLQTTKLDSPCLPDTAKMLMCFHFALWDRYILGLVDI